MNVLSMATTAMSVKKLFIKDENHSKKTLAIVGFLVLTWAGKFILAALIIAPIAYLAGKVVKRLNERTV
jgi:hypothetical protein